MSNKTSSETKTTSERIKKLISNQKYKEVGQLYSPMGITFYLESIDYDIRVHAGPSGWQNDITSFEVKEAGKQLKKEIELIEGAISSYVGSAESEEELWCKVVAVADDVAGVSSLLKIDELINEWVEFSNMALEKMAKNVMEEIR